MKPLRILLRTLSNLFLLLMLILAAALLLPRISGAELFAVLSGSMEPACPVGSLIYTAPVSMEDIAAGDIISYRLHGDGIPVTHRVVEIDDQTKRLITKGDANDIPDAAPVDYNAVIGKVKLCIPYLGYILYYINQGTGKAVFLGLLAGLTLFVLLFPDKKPRPEEKEPNER